ncbi:hypothetical protein DYB36_007080 [Aphanomyces astaci]|uniref:RNA cytidine acetyltransferase n=1 Tax=Aphanomyces astaci TaxID=112090 RepID=A0A397AAU2_APHAT|nr:hypothetical protein DYB36_007080 [Aphanomyces astaci]
MIQQHGGMGGGALSSADWSTNEWVLRVGAIVVLVMLAAVFSGLTLGLMSLDKVGLEIVVATGEEPKATAEERSNATYAKKIQPIRQDGHLLLTTLLFGNVAVNSIMAILMADMTSAIGAAALPVIYTLIAIMYVFAKPIALLLDWLVGKDMGTIFSKSEQQKLDADELGIMKGAMHYKQTPVSTILTPIADVFTLPGSTILNQNTIEHIYAMGFTRVPVWGRDLNDILGLVFVKDLIFVDPEDNGTLLDFLHLFGRSVHRVWPDSSLGDVLRAFQLGRTHLAIVHDVNNWSEVDPYYETQGVVTLEDIVEAILQADILDEGDLVSDSEMAGRNKLLHHPSFDTGVRHIMDNNMEWKSIGEPEAMKLAKHLVATQPVFQVPNSTGVQGLLGVEGTVGLSDVTATVPTSNYTRCLRISRLEFQRMLRPMQLAKTASELSIKRRQSSHKVNTSGGRSLDRGGWWVDRGVSLVDHLHWLFSIFLKINAKANTNMVKKKVDARVRTLIENCVKTNHRSFFVLVGDHGKDQVVNLHYILSKTVVKARPKVLWCYKKELGFSTHKQKRMKQIKKQMARGLYDANQDDPFELFISSTDIRWCYYKETQKILGQTYGMCVLQDFEAVTPNILARTIETVEGGGVVVLLLRTMSSLKKLYTMSMDVHARFRTEAHQDVVARFNERFILSLSSCDKCLVLDDELNVLPISKHARNIEALPPVENDVTPAQQELLDLKESLKDTQPVGALVAESRTMDQAKAVLTFVEAIAEKTLRSTVALTAGRGRGKSAALGMALAAAVAYGYSNIFVTAPSPENLGTVFDFVFKGLDALKYKEHLDYEIIQSTNPEFNHAVVRVNIFREHRQTIQYIQPTDHSKLAQAELLAIDEAAAIPLPVVKQLLGPYLVFMSSTINGYEGTGRSLSLKLIQKLREQQGSAAAAARHAASSVHGDNKTRKGERKLHEERWQAASSAAHAQLGGQGGGGTGRVLREINLDIPIRYATDDSVEKWLNDLLCLTCSSPRIGGGTPHPRDCELYYVDRDSLFSYHKLSESFLQRLMSLYVASHYKNQPNDLQLLSDAPAHHIFVLLGPQAEGQGNAGQLPDVLCVVQVALEGEISKESVQAQLSRGQRASGDLIPWTVAQQFQDNEFATLSGARMGYGSRAISLLTKYYQGDMATDAAATNEDEEEVEKSKTIGDDDDLSEDETTQLRREKVKPRKKLPPLLLPLTDRPAERLHWFGTSFGLTLPLYNFWNRAGFKSVYIRQTANPLTGEHTTIMLHALNCTDLPASPADGWLHEFVADAKRRFVSLLAYEFRTLPVTLALSLLTDPGTSSDEQLLQRAATGLIPASELQVTLTPFDVKRLQSYAKNMVDYHMIVDLVPLVARLYFLNRLPDTTLSYLQRAILMSIGLQNQSVDVLTSELNVPSNQVLALFNKAVRKFSTAFHAILEAEVAATMAVPAAVAPMVPTAETLEEDLADGKTQAINALKQKELLESLNLQKYAVRGNDDDWAAALDGVKKDEAADLKSVQVKKIKKRKDNDQDNKVAQPDSKKAKKGSKKPNSKYANLK